MRTNLRSKPAFGRFSVLILLIAACNLTGTLWAQSGGNTGQIVGQVLDPSSAAVAGVEVTVRNESTNFTRNATTDSSGRYAASLLPLGEYEITVNATGFEAAKQTAVVTLGSSITANFRLGVEPNREAVQVTATADTTLAQSKTILTALQMKEVPSNGGRIQNLIWQIPGGQIEPE